jgi:O-antigen/teichoic acid export membrane protein
MSSLKKKGIKALMWDLGGKVATQSIGLTVTIVLARLLEPSEFGTIAIVMSVIGIASIFTDIGLGGALIQRRRVLQIHYNSVFYFNIVIGIALMILFFSLSSLISTFYNVSELSNIVKVLSVLFILGALVSVQMNFLRKNLQYHIISKSNIISSMAGGVVGISMAISHYGIWSLVYQIVVAKIFHVILLWHYGGWRPDAAFSWKALKQLWSFGFRMFIAGLLEHIYSKMDYLIIGRVMSMSSLGYFQRAKSLNGLVVHYSSSSLMSVLFPVLSKIQNNSTHFNRVVYKTLLLLSFIVFLMVGILYVNANEIILILFGEKWMKSVEIFRILALTAYAYPISALLVNIIGSKGNSKAFLILEIYKKIIETFTLAILYFFDLKIYLYALVVQAFINAMILNVYFSSKEIGMPIWNFYKPVITQIFIVSISIVVVEFATFLYSYSLLLNLIWKSILFLVLYFGLSLILSTESFEAFMQELKYIIKREWKDD